MKCHIVGRHGGAVGPDLTLAGTQFPRAALIESVLYPSKAVREISFLESRRVNPTEKVTSPIPSGFQSLMNLGSLDGWREIASGTKNVTSETVRSDAIPKHWRKIESILEHDGVTGDLWREGEFGDFDSTSDNCQPVMPP